MTLIIRNFDINFNKIISILVYRNKTSRVVGTHIIKKEHLNVLLI